MAKVPQENAPAGGRKRKFRLALYDELTEDHIWKFHFTKAGITVSLIALFVLLSFLIYALIAFTPVRTLIPGYPDEHTRRVAATNAMKIDSLEYEIRKWDLYSENLRRVLSGEETLRLDSLYLRLSDRSTSAVTAEQEETLRQEETLLLEDVRRAEARENASDPSAPAPLEGLEFFTPVAGGVVTGAFERSSHPYVEITVPSGASVHAVLEGTVILTDWDDEFGYSIAIQHAGDLVSIYRRGGSLTRHAGDAVRAGTPIALTGAATDGAVTEDHLIFELWYRGSAVDPSNYISF